MIEDDDILDDLRIINKISGGKPLARKLLNGIVSAAVASGVTGIIGGATSLTSSAGTMGHPVMTFGLPPRDNKPPVETLYDAKIDDGRLQYDRKWFSND